MERLQRWLSIAARRQDLVIVIFILMVIALMILPLPTWLMDLAIAVNITIGLLFILLAVYLKSPLEFSTLPAAMLIATLIRIAITIATSRLILLQADAGQIVQGFGSFVIAGNLIVGLVIFAIIAIAQFVVITRGAERVAEVAARFALDALPGKQMSIDSDVRAGDIDRNEARRRRLKLEHESQYYGAMDGAMKFVKGDAIVSMIIIFVNLVGGIMVGSLVNGMDVSTAFSTYALLTVGDGLSSQIPALLVAVAGGIVVTRVQTTESDNLGSDMTRELVSSAQSLAIVAAALFALGLVPGFPTLIFLLLGLMAGGGAFAIFMMEKRKKQETADEEIKRDAEQAEARSAERVPTSRAGETFTLRIAPDVREQLNYGAFADTAESELTKLCARMGYAVPMAGLAIDPRIEPGTAEFHVQGAPAWTDAMPADHVFELYSHAQNPDTPLPDDIIYMPGLGQGRWIEANSATTPDPQGSDPDAARFTVDQVLGKLVIANTGRLAHHAFGLQAAEDWLQALTNEGYGSLVEQVRQGVSVARLADVIRHLLAEQVTLAHPRLVLEATLEMAPRLDDTKTIADYVRLAMSRPLSAQFASSERLISAIVIELDLEEYFRGVIIESPTGNKLSLGFDEAKNLEGALRSWQERSLGSERPLALITSFDVRRTVWHFVVSRNLQIPVLAYEEVAPDFQIVPVGSLNASALRTQHLSEHAA